MNRKPLSRAELLEAIGAILFLALLLALVLWRST